VRTSVKYLVMYRHKEKYSTSEMCRFFEVSRSGYYDFVKRMEKPDRDIPLAEQIKECQQEVKRTYGYRRVQIWLERKGIHRNPKTVLRVMQKYNLLSVVRRKRYQRYGDCLHRYQNLLNRDFHADRPNAPGRFRFNCIVPRWSFSCPRRRSERRLRISEGANRKRLLFCRGNKGTRRRSRRKQAL